MGQGGVISLFKGDPLGFNKSTEGLLDPVEPGRIQDGGWDIRIDRGVSVVELVVAMSFCVDSMYRSPRIV
jgi:hypothetical protein